MTQEKQQRGVTDCASSVQTFRTEKKIPSILVSKDVLSQLEDYILQQVPTLTALTGEALKEGTCIQVTDHFGTETVGTMKDYRPSLLPNTTKRALIRVRVRQSKAPLDLEIGFAKDRDYTDMEITYTGTNAREIVLAIVHALERLLEPHATRNWIYHPTGIFSLLPAAVVIAVLWVAASAMDRKNWEFALVLGFVVSVAAAYWAIGATLRPFSSFHTKAFEHQEKWADWAERGFATFLVFGVFFAALKDKVMAMFSK